VSFFVTVAMFDILACVGQGMLPQAYEICGTDERMYVDKTPKKLISLIEGLEKAIKHAEAR
jgi:hypothetical protein